jgi:hypothetical protein
MINPLARYLGSLTGLDVPSLQRGQVWCRECGHTQKVNSAECLRSGWPKHCGSTMTIDAPEEQARAT